MKVPAYRFKDSVKIDVAEISIRSVKDKMIVASSNNQREVQESYGSVTPKCVHVYEGNKKFYFKLLVEQHEGRIGYVPVAALSCNKECDPQNVANEILKLEL